MTRLIGLTGLARCGKDTAAAYLAHRGYKRMAFADDLKRIAAILAGEAVANFHDDVLKDKRCEWLDMTRRKLMQTLGTECVRTHFGPDIWANNLMRSWRMQGTPLAVISDVRFDNEAKAVTEHGGVVVRIERPGAGLVGDSGAHASERGVQKDLVDFVVINNGTLADLYQTLDELLAKIEEGGRANR